MKVAVVGNGNVGKAAFRELQSFREIDELVIVGRNEAACRAEAEDYLDAIPLRVDFPAKVLGGGYELARNADILVYCTGPSVTKEDRLSIADINVKIVREVFAKLDKYAPDAMVIVVTNPVDVITTAITKFTGRPSNRVIGTGTLLDTARLIKALSWSFRLGKDSVRGYVVGEHGNSSVVLRSSVRVVGMPAENYLKDNCEGKLPALGMSKEEYQVYGFGADSILHPDMLENEIREAGFRIFRGKGYTSSGVAAAAARIVFEILNDARNIYPVSTVLHGEYGIDGIAISVPCILGKNGIESIQKVFMTDEERNEFIKSAEIIRKTCVDNGIPV